MDALKTLDSALFSQSTKKQFQGEIGNKDLWLRALEKNSLYSSLEKFEVIEGQQRYEVTVKNGYIAPHGKRESNAKEGFLIKETITDSKPTALESNDLKTNKIVNYKNQGAVDSGTLHLLNINNQYTLNVFGAGNNKGVRLAGLFKSYDVKMPWLSKNTTVTMANSGLEVWVRDTGITGSKLSEVLKHLQHTMANLGVSLAKVTINGKVVFNEKNHHSSMEG